MSDGGLALVGLLARFEGDRPDQVVAILGVGARNDPRKLRQGCFGFGGRRRQILSWRNALGQNAERGMHRRRAHEEDKRE
jgi:hypothetical protein